MMRGEGLMREEDNLHAKVFIIVAVIIFSINLFGIFYGIVVDAQLEEAKETLRIVYDKEYDDNVSKIIADLEMSSKVLGRVLVGFGLKGVVGTLLATLLILPERLYKMFETYIFSYITPNCKYEFIISAIMVAMSLWNMVSPFLEIGDYIGVNREIVSALASLNTEVFINSFSMF